MSGKLSPASPLCVAALAFFFSFFLTFSVTFSLSGSFLFSNFLYNVLRPISFLILFVYIFMLLCFSLTLCFSVLLCPVFFSLLPPQTYHGAPNRIRVECMGDLQIWFCLPLVQSSSFPFAFISLNLFSFVDQIDFSDVLVFVLLALRRFQLYRGRVFISFSSC